MADNTTLNAGSGGDTFAADVIGGVKYPRSKIVLGADGTNDGDVSSANPLPISGVVTVSGGVAVTGTFWQATQPVSGTFWQATQPVSAAALPLPSGASTEAKQDTGNTSLAAAVTALQIIDNIVSGSEAQVDVVAALPTGDNNIGNVDLASAIPAGDNAIGRVKLTDGTDVADVLDLTNSNPLTVAIVDGSGTQITSFGGGTQYTEGDTDASITGTALMWEDTSNTLVAASATKPVPVNIISGAGSGGTAAADDADFTAGTTSGTPIMGVATGAAAVTSGDLGTVGMTVDRELWTYDSEVFAQVGSLWTLIDAISGSGSLLASETTLAALDAKVTACNTGAVVIASGSVSISGTVTVGSHAVTNAGTFAVQAACTNAGTFVTQENGAALTALQLIDDVIFADDAAFTPGTSKVAAIGMQADESSTDSVDEGDIGCPRMTLDRKQLVVPQAHSAGGATPYRKISAGSSGDATNVKASAGTVYGIQVFNTNAAAAYLKLYDSASAPTAGSGTPVKVILIPGATTGAGAILDCPVGINFASGIGFTIVTGSADSNSTSVAASEVHVNIDYK